jgi:hypothetical protein
MKNCICCSHDVNNYHRVDVIFALQQLYQFQEKNIKLSFFGTIHAFVPQRAYPLGRWWSDSCLYYLSWAVYFDPLPTQPATIRHYLGDHPCAMKRKVRMTGKICIAQQRGSKVGSLRTVATCPAHLVVLGLAVITSCDQYKSSVGPYATFLWRSFKLALTLLWEGFAGLRRKSGYWRWQFRWRLRQQVSGIPNIVYKHFVGVPQKGSNRSQGLYLHVDVRPFS